MNKLFGDETFKLRDISDIYGKIMESCTRHQEALAYAFMESTGLKPEEIELVEMRTETGYRWFYKKLEPSIREKMDYSTFQYSTKDMTIG